MLYFLTFNESHKTIFNCRLYFRRRLLCRLHNILFGFCFICIYVCFIYKQSRTKWGPLSNLLWHPYCICEFVVDRKMCVCSLFSSSISFPMFLPIFFWFRVFGTCFHLTLSLFSASNGKLLRGFCFLKVVARGLRTSAWVWHLKKKVELFGHINAAHVYWFIKFYCFFCSVPYYRSSILSGSPVIFSCFVFFFNAFWNFLECSLGVSLLRSAGLFLYSFLFFLHIEIVVVISQVVETTPFSISIWNIFISSLNKLYCL